MSFVLPFVFVESSSLRRKTCKEYKLDEAWSCGRPAVKKSKDVNTVYDAFPERLVDEANRLNGVVTDLDARDCFSKQNCVLTFLFASHWLRYVVLFS